MTIKEKILAYLDFKGIKKSDFFESTGISASNFKGNAKLSELGGDKIAKILAIYEDLSAEWLMANRGDMLKTKRTLTQQDSKPSPLSGDEDSNNQSEKQSFNANYPLEPSKDNPNATITQDERYKDAPVATPATSPGEGIPLIPFEAMAGALTSEQTVLEYECERYVVPVFRGADFLMPVRGSSMYPKYSSGDIVACQRVPMSDIFFQWNKVYVLDTVQGALIKRVKPGSDNSHVLLVSDNKSYNPLELPVSAIHALALVIGVIRLE